MAVSPEDLLARMADMGIRTRTVQHPPLFTVEDAKAHRGDLQGGHTKNLFLKDKKGGLWLVTCLEDRRVDLKALNKRLGAARFSFGKPDLLMEVLGVVPGSVTPLSIINDTEGRVTLVLDEDLMNHDPLNFHPLTNEATTQISAADLLTFVRETGHEPVISPIDEIPDDNAAE